ncbi:hypothetical protein BH10ACT9_BH10ACT9_19730 [soil metagenome]
MGSSAVTSTPHTMTRVDVFTGVPYDEFRAAFEQAAPAFDPAPFQRIAHSGGSWAEVEAAAAVMAPHQLMRYAHIDAAPLFALAGHRAKVIEYLLGNHVIAETMFRHDPHAMLYAPLRVLVYSDADDNAVWSMDRPSDAFGSLDHHDITEVGYGLDAKVAALLRVIGVDADAVFARQSA